MFELVDAVCSDPTRLALQTFPSSTEEMGVADAAASLECQDNPETGSCPADTAGQRTILTSPSGLWSRTHSESHRHRSLHPRDVGRSRVGLAWLPEREPRSHRVPDIDG